MGARSPSSRIATRTRTSPGAATSTSSTSAAGRCVSSRRVAGSRRGAPQSWSPDGRWIAAIGTRDWRRGELPQASVWRIRSRDGHAENLIPTRPTSRRPAAMNSDLMGGLPLRPAVDGRRPMGRLRRAGRGLLRAVARRGRWAAPRAAHARSPLPRAASDPRRPAARRRSRSPPFEATGDARRRRSSSATFPPGG